MAESWGLKIYKRKKMEYTHQFLDSNNIKFLIIY